MLPEHLVDLPYYHSVYLESFMRPLSKLRFSAATSVLSTLLTQSYADWSFAELVSRQCYRARADRDLVLDGL